MRDVHTSFMVSAYWSYKQAIVANNLMCDWQVTGGSSLASPEQRSQWQVPSTLNITLSFHMFHFISLIMYDNIVQFKMNVKFLADEIMDIY